MAGLVLVSILKYAEAENNAKMLHWISLKIVPGELYRFLKINHLFSEMMFSKNFYYYYFMKEQNKTDSLKVYEFLFEKLF